MTLVIGILGAGIGSGLMSIILAWLNRKWNKQDKEDDKIAAIIVALRTMMIDRITHLGNVYISKGEITLGAKENLKAMHRACQRLGLNGDLDTIMAEIEKLKVVVE